MLKLIAFILIISINSIFADITYQRLSSELVKTNILTTGINFSRYYFNLTGTNTYNLFPSIVISYKYLNRYYCQTTFPFILKILQTENPQRQFNSAFGDPSIEIGWMTKINDLRARANINYIYPLGNWNSYQSGDYGLMGGSGYHTLALGFGISKILDPVILNALISYSISFPRSELYGWSMKPGDFMMDLNIIEALNDEIAWNIGLKSSINLPVINTGIFKLKDTTYNAYLYFSILYYFGDTDLKLSISKDVTSILSSFITTFEGYYNFEY